jgi:hypothetical protein
LLGWSRFPSPQGGSETAAKPPRPLPIAVSIPSRRVGDLQRDRCGVTTVCVSIPSRRVGDQTDRPRPEPKGKFPSPQGGSETAFGGLWASTLATGGFHPLKAGRRRWLPKRWWDAIYGFHPLKAGRRPLGQKATETLTKLFPSPQGGSETRRLHLHLVP